MRFIAENKNNIWCNKKGHFWHYIFKKILTRIFLKFSGKRVLNSLGQIFSNVNRGMIQKPDEVETWLSLRQVFEKIYVFYYIFYVVHKSL